MIHFNFIVSDEDADTIMDAMQRECVQCNDYILFEKMSPAADQAMIDWWARRKIMIEELMTKMTNTKVLPEDGNTDNGVCDQAHVAKVV